jgi:hypothetical protein
LISINDFLCFLRGRLDVKLMGIEVVLQL